MYLSPYASTHTIYIKEGNPAISPRIYSPISANSYPYQAMYPPPSSAQYTFVSGNPFPYYYPVFTFNAGMHTSFPPSDRIFLVLYL